MGAINIKEQNQLFGLFHQGKNQHKRLIRYRITYREGTVSNEMKAKNCFTFKRAKYLALRLGQGTKVCKNNTKHHKNGEVSTWTSRMWEVSPKRKLIRLKNIETFNDSEKICNVFKNRRQKFLAILTHQNQTSKIRNKHRFDHIPVENYGDYSWVFFQLFKKFQFSTVHEELVVFAIDELLTLMENSNYFIGTEWEFYAHDYYSHKIIEFHERYHNLLSSQPDEQLEKELNDIEKENEEEKQAFLIYCQLKENARKSGKLIKKQRFSSSVYRKNESQEYSPTINEISKNRFSPLNKENQFKLFVNLKELLLRIENTETGILDQDKVPEVMFEMGKILEGYSV